MTRQPELSVGSSPFLGGGLSTPGLMWEVIWFTLPIVAVAVRFFGMSAILVVGSATVGAVLTEALITRPRGSSLADGSALLTGLLLGLTLPPGLPMWMAFAGGVVAIVLGKLIWGGLGQNMFNPALVGRAFLQAAFPIAMTSWLPPSGLTSFAASNLAWPFTRPPGVDAVATATPLNLMKFGHHATSLGKLAWGNTGGSLGETSALLLVVIGLLMIWRRLFDWRIPVSILLTVAVFSETLSLTMHEPGPLFMLCSGGLLLGTVFMATDPVTSPMAPTATWIYGIGIGVLVVLIRLFGGLPEGVMYAILLMNAATPHIERAFQPRPFGRGGKRT